MPRLAKSRTIDAGTVSGHRCLAHLSREGNVGTARAAVQIGRGGHGMGGGYVVLRELRNRLDGTAPPPWPQPGVDTSKEAAQERMARWAREVCEEADRERIAAGKPWDLLLTHRKL